MLLQVAEQLAIAGDLDAASDAGLIDLISTG
jgi:hypothetical protein